MYITCCKKLIHLDDSNQATCTICGKTWLLKFEYNPERVPIGFAVAEKDDKKV